MSNTAFSDVLVEHPPVDEDYFTSDDVPNDNEPGFPPPPDYIYGWGDGDGEFNGKLILTAIIVIFVMTTLVVVFFRSL